MIVSFRKNASVCGEKSDMNLTLDQISRMLKTSLKGESRSIVTGVSTDSRTLKKGMLFFALRGEHFDGHDYLGNAFSQGASAVVVDRRWPGAGKNGKNWNLIEVDDTLTALQEMASAYRKRFEIPVIAVTGSNGKTTTKEMIAQILGTRYKVAKSPGNLNNPIGVSLSICGWQADDEMAVLEMGTNHFGEIRRLGEIAAPTHGLITNIGKGHLEFFNDLEGVFRAKVELLDSLHEGVLFLNGDDPFLQRIRNRLPQTITFGLSGESTFRPEEWGMDGSGCPWMTIDRQRIQMAVSGKHQLYNGLAAIAVARTFGIQWARIQKTLSGFQSVDKRMEKVEAGGLVILNDSYNANPGSVEQAVLALASMQSLKRRIVCLGDMLELGKASRTEHEKAGESIIKNKMDALVCYGPETLATVEKARDLGLKSAFHFDAKSELNEFLCDFLREGDGLLVKGSRGMKMEEVVQALLVHFNGASI
jgi:UDP-N-acetylmuramoyl-tripeptide--D-alanyl-D-alanine ligase